MIAAVVIERYRNLSSTPDAVARRCVLGKDTDSLLHDQNKSGFFGGPAFV